MIQSSIKYKKDSEKGKLALFMLNLSLIFTVVIQFFLESGLYSLLRPRLYLSIILTLLLVITAKSKVKRNPFFNFYFVIIYLSAIATFLIGFFVSKVVTGTLIEFSMPFVIIYIGIKCNINRDQLSKLVLRYMIAATLLGLFIIFHYGNGFRISAQYFFDSKNSVGPFLGSVTVLSLITLINKNNVLKISKYWLVVIFTINISTLTVLRNRSGLVAVGICLLVYLIAKINFKQKIRIEKAILAILSLLVLLVLVKMNLLNPIYDVIYRSLFLNYDVTDLNSISAQRFDVYQLVFRFLGDYPFFGELSSPSNIYQTPHNYLIYLWLRYGLLGMLPITIFYIYLWIYVLFKTVFIKKNDIGLFLMLYALVVSLFEPSLPFSPLTTVTLGWFLFGHFMDGKKLSLNQFSPAYQEYDKKENLKVLRIE